MKLKWIIMLLLTPVLYFQSSQAGTGDSSPGNIHPNVKLGFSERFRMVTWDNAVSLTDQAGSGSTFTRHRTCLWGQWFPRQQYELTLKLTNEFRYYFVPEDRDNDMDEVFVDQLYAKIKNAGGLPATLTLGRQNIMLGEGFVIMDGHPLDGSRSIYFNAARLDWNLGKRHTLVLFYGDQPETDDLLPTINDQDQPLIEQEERAVVAYLIGSRDELEYNAYFIRKDIDDTDARPIESSINTVGARIAFPSGDRLSITGEGAYQFGEYGDADRSAFGGYIHLDYSTGRRLHLPRLITLGGVYLTGDESGTEEWEGWDPLFSRWPKWS